VVPSFIILVTAFLTATLSGVFGMAGGLALMGVLAVLLPVQAAFVTHGALQLVANGWRTILHRRHVRWSVIGWYALGALVAAVVAGALASAPPRPWLFLLMGLTPLLTWLPQRKVALDASRPVQAAICGLAVSGLNLTAGVAGPLLDIFFVRTELTRHQIVATKAATQTLSHLAKIAVYGAPLIAAGGQGLPPVWVFAVAVPLSMAGTVVGGRILDRLTDVDFKRWTRLIVTGIGVTYLIQAAQLFLAPG
jgi:uncharacterized protein